MNARAEANTVQRKSCLDLPERLPSPRDVLSVPDDGWLRGEGQGEGEQSFRAQLLFPSPQPSPNSAHDAATHDEMWGEGERGVAAKFQPNRIGL
jgi:hypothetical protein